MRLPCEKALLLLFASTVGCREATTPSTTVSRIYVLETLNGQPLPAILSAGQSDTTRVLWATLTLDATGTAVIIEHRLRVSPTNVADEATFTSRFDYRITGDSITVGSFQACQCCLPCAFPLEQVGRVTGTTLTLTFRINPPPPTYLYRLAQTY
jgi:hypothetical protein